MKNSSIVKINLRGTIFLTNQAKFKSFPNSRLAKLSATDSNYDAERNEFYFDRNPFLFHFILDLYEYADLHLPKNVCSTYLRRELKFWKLPKTPLGICCLGTFYSDDNEIDIYNQYERKQQQYEIFDDETFIHKQSVVLCGKQPEERDMNSVSETRKEVWRIISKPFSSSCAKIYYAVLLLCVMTSIITFGLSTMEDYRQPRSHRIQLSFNVSSPKLLMYLNTRQLLSLSAADIISNTFLTIDFILIVYSCPSRKALLKEWYIWFDLFVLVSVFCLNIIDQTDLLCNIYLYSVHIIGTWVGFVYGFRILKILRLINHSTYSIALYMTFYSCISFIVHFLFGYFVFCLLYATIIYFAELWAPSSFLDIFSSVWWAVITISSVGYGDMVPETVTGKCCAIVIILSGLLLVTIPFVIITTKYGDYYTCYENIRKHEVKEEDDNEEEILKMNSPINRRSKCSSS